MKQPMQWWRDGKQASASSQVGRTAVAASVGPTRWNGPVSRRWTEVVRGEETTRPDPPIRRSRVGHASNSNSQANTAHEQVTIRYRNRLVSSQTFLRREPQAQPENLATMEEPSYSQRRAL